MSRYHSLISSHLFNFLMCWWHCDIQWNLRITDAIGMTAFVLLMEVVLCSEVISINFTIDLGLFMSTQKHTYVL